MEENKEAVMVETPTEASQVTESTAKSYPVEELPGVWFAIEPEKLSAAQFKAKGPAYIYGSRNLTKMITFLKDVKLSKEDVDYWMDFQRFPVKRNSDELYENYKIRLKFQNALVKYRKEVRAFSIMHTLQTFIDTQKAKKDNEVIEQIQDQNKQINEKIESHE